MVIPSVLERIIDRIQIGRKTVDPCQGNVAPRIVGIGADLYAVFIVYRNDVPLQVPLKPEGIELARGHTFCAVLHADRSTVSVVEINAKIAAPLFCRNLRTGQEIGMFNPVDHLLGTDALIVVLVGRVDVLRCIVPNTCHDVRSEVERRKQSIASRSLFQT